MSEPSKPPATHDVYDVIRGCSRKARYDSEQNALRTAARVYAIRRTSLRAYSCVEGCGGWHLTRMDAPPPPNAANLRPPRKSARQLASERNKQRDRRRRR